MMRQKHEVAMSESLRSALAQLVEQWRDEAADESERINRGQYGNRACSPEFIAGQRRYARAQCEKANSLAALLAAGGTAPREDET